MHLTTLITLCLVHLPTLTLTTALPPRAAAVSASRADAYLPAKVLWHSSSSTNTLLSTANNAANTVSPAANVSACGAIAYDHSSPARTAVVRDDCYTLALQVQAAPGFWELYKWSRDDEDGSGSGKREFVPLISDGTCEFAVKRRDVPAWFNSTMSSNSDVVIIGNHDVFNILNASVYDLAYAADEPYVDAERNQGHMDCKWWFAVNASIEFRIQKTGTQ